MTPKDHAKACEPLIKEMQDLFLQASRQLVEMRASITNGSFATANIDAQRIVNFVQAMEVPSRQLRGHTFEAAVKAGRGAGV